MFLIYHLKASKQNTLFSLPRCKYLEKGPKMIAIHRKRDNRPTSFQICCLNSVSLGARDMLAEEKNNVCWRRKIKVSEKYVRRPQLLASLREEDVLTQFNQRYVFFQKNSVRTGGITPERPAIPDRSDHARRYMLCQWNCRSSKNKLNTLTERNTL